MDQVLNVFCSTFPVRLLAYIPFGQYLRFSKRVVAIVVAVSMALELWTVAWAVGAGQPGLARAIEFLFTPICLSACLINIRMAPSKLMFTYILLIDYLVIVNGLASYLSVQVFDTQPRAWQGSLCCLALYLITWPLMLRFFRRAVEQVYQIDAPALWRTIWLIPALTSAVVLAFTGALDEATVGRWTVLFARVSLLLCMLMVYWVLLQSLESLRRQAALQEQARQSGYILAAQRAQYLQLRQHMEEIRRARHDLRQHIKLIQACLASGDREALQRYIDQYGASLPADTQWYFCKNFAVNTLMNYYAGQFEEKGIDFEVQASLPEKLAMPEPDLCVVLGNLLENAGDACVGQASTYIRVVVKRTDARAITLIVDNTAPVPPQRLPNGTYRSHKGEGGGVGIPSVQHLARQYHGLAEFRWDGGMFYASVFFNPKPDQGGRRPAEPAHANRCRGGRQAERQRNGTEKSGRIVFDNSTRLFGFIHMLLCSAADLTRPRPSRAIRPRPAPPCDPPAPALQRGGRACR